MLILKSFKKMQFWQEILIVIQFNTADVIMLTERIGKVINNHNNIILKQFY